MFKAKTVLFVPALFPRMWAKGSDIAEIALVVKSCNRGRTPEIGTHCCPGAVYLQGAG